MTGPPVIPAGEAASPPVELPAPNTPLAVAQALVKARYSRPDGARLLRHWRGSFWSWKTSHWAEVEDAAVRTEVYHFTEHAEYVDAKGDVKPWAPNRYKVADLLDALRAVGHLAEGVTAPTWIAGTGQRPNEIVACANGLLHVPTRHLAPHNPGYFNLVSVPFDYDADAPTPTRWVAFLEELWHDDPDAIAALQEFFGYVISGRLDLQKILLLIGPTRAGKGVIARVLKALVGAGNAAGPTLASLGTNFGLSPLIGKPLAIISDARLGGASAHQIVERLLSISGEDMLTIDRKYREPWTGTLPARFVVISNELPRFGDASGAIANRFIVLTLARSWLGRENPALTRELLDELPSILGWALVGLDRLGRGRFTEPRSSSDAIVALADIASPTSAFVRDRCTVGPQCDVAVTELFAAWKTWCEDNGRDRPGNVQIFGRDLRAVIPGLGTSRPRDGSDRRTPLRRPPAHHPGRRSYRNPQWPGPRTIEDHAPGPRWSAVHPIVSRGQPTSPPSAPPSPTAGAKLPPPVTQAIAERDTIVAAANALPVATTEAIADAIAAALLDNRDPFDDDHVQHLLLAQVAAGATGDAVRYIVQGAAERRIVAAIAGNVDAILDPLIAAANRLGTVLATAYQVIGDHDLDDHAGILAMGENAARAWADARTALQQLRVITAGWLALAELTGFASTSVDPILRFADVTVDEYDHHGRRPDVWQLIRSGVTIDYANGTTIRARTAAIAAERARRQAIADGELGRRYQRTAGTGVVA